MLTNDKAADTSRAQGLQTSKRLNWLAKANNS